jgi:hypothetical protein
MTTDAELIRAALSRTRRTTSEDAALLVENGARSFVTRVATEEETSDSCS